MWFNPLVSWLLRSPFHGLVSKGTVLLTVTGLKSGKPISTPTNYLRDGNTLWIISWRDRKWWRNLRGGAKMGILLAGKTMEGHGQVSEEEDRVAQDLFEYYQKVPKLAKYVQIGLDSGGKPIMKDCQAAARKMVVVWVELE